MNHNSQNYKAIFLDRDGTINVEIQYLHEPEKFEFLPSAIRALKNLQENGFKLIIITNQAGIAKNLYKHEDMVRTHNHMENLLEKENIYLDGIYYCPHKSEDKCECRKPSPGMIKKAILEKNIDPSKSWMIGDKISDIKSGNLAEVRTILVMTGYGREQLEIIADLMQVEKLISTPDYIVEDLMKAAEIVLGK